MQGFSGDEYGDRSIEVIKIQKIYPILCPFHKIDIIYIDDTSDHKIRQL